MSPKRTTKRAQARPPKPAPAAKAEKPDRPTVTIGGQSIRLGRPASLAVRIDVIAAVSTSEVRGLAAALGICWEAGSPRPPAQYAKFRYDALRYGGAVLDALLGRGVPLGEIMTAGQEAFLWLAESVPTGDRVQAHEDFCEAPGPSSTG